MAYITVHSLSIPHLALIVYGNRKGGGFVSMHLYLSGAFGIYKHVGLCVRPPPVSNENEFFNDCAYGRYASGFPR